ncbi:MAG: endonuclease/exonuclease/phosphatase family protein [Candidatus Cryptobacteroides sp.]
MKKIVRLSLLLAAVLAFSACGKKHSLRIVTYNVGVFHKADTNTVSMVADMMNELGAQVLSLNELDSCTVRTGHEYQLDSLARELGGWNYRYASSIDHDGGRYGIGVACEPGLEILDFDKIFLPREHLGEQRVLAVAEFKDFIFASTHLDFSNKEDQLQQAVTATSWLKEHYAECGKPVFLCGDMNAAPDSETMAEYRKDWTILSAQDFTIPSSRPDVCIDYIMLLNGTAKCKVLKTCVPVDFKSGDVTIASDHLPVMAVVEW